MKFFNFELKATGGKWLLQLNKVAELRFSAYESSRIYKEQMKKLHDKNIHQRELHVDDLVLFFDLRLNLFSSKLCSR